MAIGKVDINQRKVTDTLKKKQDKIINAEVLLEVEDIGDSYIITLDADVVIEPYMRNRTSVIKKKNAETGQIDLINGHMYDPLSKYKELLEKKITSQLPEDYELPRGEAEIEIHVTSTLPQNATIKEKLAALKYGELKPLKKPDVDNIAKTIMDVYNEVIWKDDTQLYKIQMEKSYGFKPRTLVKLTIKKDERIYFGRATKEETEEWNSIQQNF